MPLSFWAEAISTAVYIQNRSPTVQLKDVTPYERWYNKKQDVSNLKIFGCKAFVHISDAKQNGKLDKKSIPYIFVRYPTTENGFKLFTPGTRQMLRSRDVIFSENKFESDITGCGEKGCEFFTDKIQFHIYNDSDDTELTHDDAAVPVYEEEAAQLQQNRRAPDRLGALTGD